MSEEKKASDNVRMYSVKERQDELKRSIMEKIQIR
jgi:hypothetical protein